MRPKIKLLFPLIILLAIPKKILAVCPVCTVAVGAGVGLSRWLGIDDTISGIWVGGLLISLTIWTIDWLKKRKIRFPFRKIITALFYYVIVFIPLYSKNIVGAPYNKLCGLDKLIFGTIIGTASFLLAAKVHFALKKKNNDKSYFPFQKVVLPVGTLIILSIIFYFITKCS